MTVRSARVAAQAKLNLWLRIVGREPSGYHQLNTLFQRIALADDVTVRVGGAGRTLDCAGAEVGPVEQNLAWRAAIAYADAAPWLQGFSIEIAKHIPVGGGLGGGSADAAAVLRALDALAPIPMPEETLAGIAFRLGADVPYLTSTHALALGTGRGERLIALPPLPTRDVWLLLPDFGVSSKSAFGWHAARRGSLPYPPDLTLLPSPLSWSVVEQLAVNDLEPDVFLRHELLHELRGTLEMLGASIARMSGSGSTVFGVFANLERIERLTADARARAAALGHDVSKGFVGIGVDFDRWATRLVPTSTVEQVARVELQGE